MSRPGSSPVLGLSIRTAAGERTEEIHAEDTPADLGRAGSCRVVLDDRGCSRHHARISFLEGRFVLRDLSSANGTRLNGQPVREATLAAGDRIALGGVEIGVSLPEPPPPVILLLTQGQGREEALYEIDTDSVLVGRSGACGIRLSDPACSRRQALLRRSPKGLRLKVLGGSTLLNGTPVREALLAEGDVLSFGTATLAVRPAQAPEDSGLEAPVRHRVRRARRPESALPMLAGIGLCVAAGAMAWVWATHPSSPAGIPDRTQAGPSRTVPLPPPPATEASSVEPRRTALAAIRADQDAPPEKLDLLRSRCWDLIQRFPDTEEATEALRIVQAAQKKWESLQDARWIEARKAVEELCGGGELRQARAVLTAFLGNAGRVHEREGQALLLELDRCMEQEYGQAEEAAMAQARAGRFAEARAALTTLKARYAGLPWGSAAQARLSELGPMEEERRQLILTEETRRREEAEAKLAVEERRQQRVRWATDQGRLLQMLSPWSPKQEKERRTCFEAIAAVDPALSPPLAEGLAKAHRDLLARLKTRLGAAEIRDLRDRLRGNLDLRRKEALDLIRDEVRYPYLHGQANPYGPDGPKVQREVDDLVSRVEEAYRPTQEAVRALRESKGTGEVLAGVEETEEYLTRSGAAPAHTDSLQGLLEKVFADAFDFAKEAEALRTNAEVMTQVAADARRLRAEGVLDAEEEDCILITNRYRIMMGLDPLRIDPRLLKASRGHSDDMTARNYFAHNDPEGRGPGNRAQAAGFSGAAGENIYMGSPSGRAAFEGWRHSSGHHRAMLGAMWTVIGVARRDARWTMMLGAP